MSKRFVDVEKSNLYLFDLLFRHQVYLEGIKVGIAAHFREMLKRLYDEFAKYVGQSRYDQLDAFTRVEFKNFIYKFQQAQAHEYNKYTQQLIVILRDFLAADVEVTKAIYAASLAHPASKPAKTAKSIDETQFGSDSGNRALWADVTNEIVPATGQTLSEMLIAFGHASLAKVSNRLSIGYANNETVRETFAAIVGSHDAGYRDGIFSTFLNQNAALIATGVQHVSSMTQAAIATHYYSQYQWVAILDSRTTLICRSRNGNVYTYGEGPLPPAHWFCRSKAVSLTEGDALHDIPSTFYDWAITQPKEFLVDAFGAALATKFLAQDNSVSDLSITNAASPLTVSEFRNKINLITM